MSAGFLLPVMVRTLNTSTLRSWIHFEDVDTDSACTNRLNLLQQMESGMMQAGGRMIEGATALLLGVRVLPVSLF